MAITQTPEEDDALTALAQTIGAARRYGMPVMAEMLPTSYGPTDENTRSNIIGASCRLAWEYGADIVKTRYSPDGNFTSVIQQTGLPVVVLGGARTGDVHALLQMIEAAIRDGASGVAMGRNVWQHPNSGAMTRAIVAMVHEGATAEEAAGYLR